MTHFAVITAKGNNDSLVDKNLAHINGIPTVRYSINAALNAKHINKVFVSTECPKIKKYVGGLNNVHVINRPKYLSQSDSNHGDVIVHAAKFLKEKFEDYDTLTILLGNTGMTTSRDIDNAIEKLLSDDNASSCMTVWRAQDDHPYRAMKVNENGYLESFYKLENISTNRQSYPIVFYYDQGPWVVYMDTIFISVNEKKGPGPWWWMGKNVIYIERPWVTGRDTHSQLDIKIAEWWLKNNKTKT